MKSKSLFLVFFLISFFAQSQITDFKEKFTLPSETKETSGLLFLDGKIITHNDSGDAANLYEIDSLSGNLLRTININNATNIDWEDITDDKNYIYIGDFGNNNGDRTNLKIYKILKSDFKNSNSLTAEEITFSYQDQSDFTSNPNNNNFDAEAFVVDGESIFIFSKNWTNFTTNVYKIPKTIGNHSALKVSSANVEGLITGATLFNNNFLLCGYSSTAIPFIIHISSNRNTGDDIFNSGFNKHTLSTELEQGSQVEAITSFDNGRFYISREAVNNAFVNLPQKLYEFKDDRTKVLSIEKNDLEDFKIAPNPTSNKIFIQSKNRINSTSIYNTLGKRVLFINSNQKEIDISQFQKGIYLLRVKFHNQKAMQERSLNFKVRILLMSFYRFSC